MGMVASFVRGVAVAAVAGVAGAGVALAAAAAAAVPAGAQPAPAAAIRAGFLEAVSCAGATACTAVGEHPQETSLAERWDGTKWARQRTPSGGPLDAVSCSSATACTALGGSLGALAWNGTIWASQRVPIPSGNGSGLTGVSCTSARACTAVGFAVKSDGTQVALADRWDGTAWALQHVANPSDGTTPVLTGVSCSAATACTAVGVRNGPPGSPRLTLAERWNGTTWTIQPT